MADSDPPIGDVIHGAEYRFRYRLVFRIMCDSFQINLNLH